MSFRFQKRVRIAPGVRINFSKRGVSASAGPRGSTLTVGKRGLYGNLGIPGSGLSYRTRLDKNAIRSRNNTQQGQATRTPSVENSNNPIQVAWNEELGDFSFTTASGHFLNAQEERQVRRTYKLDLVKMYKEKAEEINHQTERLLDLHHQLFYPEHNFKAIVEASLPELEAPPSREEYMRLVTDREKNMLNFWNQIKILFPTFKKEFNDKIEKLVEAEYNETMTSYNSEKQAIQEEKHSRRQLALKAETGELEAMEEWVSLFLNELDFPLETDVDFTIVTAEELYADIDLPTIDEIPIKKADILKSGKLKIKDKTQRDHREDYALLVGGTALYIASFFFRYLPTLKNVYISGYNQVLDVSTGHETDQYIYSLKINKEVLYSLNMENVHPIRAFENFQPRLDVTKTFIFKEITPYSPSGE
ncbi:MAG: DUF4236 domain-containing protein [Bacillus sp. (in: Bacteria)]|nr:DUF4236 domain-containing protein [Bacillus sp. (in: firmicutes)]